jgi:hypothetical protein
MILREMAIYSTCNSCGQVAAGFMSIFSLSQSDYYYYHLQSTLKTSSSPSSWVSNIISMLTAWIADYGYPAVFAAALLETIFPPIPSEIVFPLAGFPGLENYNATNKDNKSSERLEVRLSILYSGIFPQKFCLAYSNNSLTSSFVSLRVRYTDNSKPSKCNYK